MSQSAHYPVCSHPKRGGQGIRVLCVFGTRPEAIKMAPVIHAFKAPGRATAVVCCSTGQHKEMLAQVLELFSICPDFHLDVMRPNQSLSGLTSALLTALDGTVRETKPDWILSQGDTTTTMVASLVAFYNMVNFGHVEAGLRTGDLARPFPEEANRRIADIVATRYFAPTEANREALLREGVASDKIDVTGNTVVDALRQVAAMPYDWLNGPMRAIPRGGRLVLVTAHRRESFGPGIENICAALRELAERFPEVHFVYPVHLNPNVQEPVIRLLSGIANLHLLPPLDYLSLVHLLKSAYLVLTDSGGIQEEAPTFGVPVLVMRETTERQEGVDAGVVKLVGTDARRIVEEASMLLTSERAYGAMAKGINPYGDGRAAQRIVTALLDLQGDMK